MTEIIGIPWVQLESHNCWGLWFKKDASRGLLKMPKQIMPLQYELWFVQTGLKMSFKDL